MNQARARAVLVVSTIANVVLMALKLSMGVFANSRALIADGVNSGVDIFTSVMVLVSFRWASKPADKIHPYGHGNIEVLVAFLVSLLVIGTGGFVAYDGIRSALAGGTQVPKLVALAAAGFTIAAKLALYFYARSVSRHYRSPAVAAQAADHRSDILATSAALLGITLARFRLSFLDPLAAAVIAGFIIWTGVKLARENLHVLLDAQPGEEFFLKIERSLQGFREIERVRRMRAHPVGTYYFLELTVTISGDLSVKKGHDIAERIRTRLMGADSTLKDVIVHVEPAGN